MLAGVASGRAAFAFGCSAPSALSRNAMIRPPSFRRSSRPVRPAPGPGGVRRRRAGGRQGLAGVAPGSEAADWDEKTIGGDDGDRNVTVPT